MNGAPFGNKGGVVSGIVSSVAAASEGYFPAGNVTDAGGVAVYPILVAAVNALLVDAAILENENARPFAGYGPHFPRQGSPESAPRGRLSPPRGISVKVCLHLDDFVPG